MTATISHWGNSQGIRLPKNIMKKKGHPSQTKKSSRQFNKKENRQYFPLFIKTTKISTLLSNYLMKKARFFLFNKISY